MTMKNKTNIPKLPRPEVCDSCFLDGNLVFNNETQEWLCTECNELIKQDSRDFDYSNGSIISRDNVMEW